MGTNGYEDDDAFNAPPQPAGRSAPKAAANPLMAPGLWGDIDEAPVNPPKGSSLDDAWVGPPLSSSRPTQDDLDAAWPKSAKAAPSGELDDLDAAWPRSDSAARPTSTWSDVAKSGASGVRSGIEGLLGLPGAASSGRDWLISKALEKTGYSSSDAAKMTDRWFGWSDMPSSETIHNKLSSWGVPDHTPQTTAGKYAHTVGEFVPGALTIPETKLPAIAKNLIKYGLIPGLASEAGGQAFEGTPAEPYVRTAAGLAGGLGAGAVEQVGRAGLGAAKQFAEPLTKAGRQNWAARTFQGMFADKDAAQTALNTAKAMQAPGRAMGETVSGSLPTTGQLTGDLGALSAEREMSTRDPAFFKSNPHGTGSEQQNAARTQSLEGVQPTGAPEAVGQAVRDRLAQIEAQHDATTKAAHQVAQQAASGVSSGATPEAIGANLRDALQTGRDAAKVNERALWKAVDPDGTLAMPATPIAKAANDLTKALPATAKPMAGEEAAIFNTAANLPAAAPFNDVTALRSRISTAMREEMRSAGQTPAYARLSQLRGSVESAISDAAAHKAAQDAAAVSAGELDHAATIGARVEQRTSQVQGLPVSGIPAGEISAQAASARAPGGNQTSGASGAGNARLRDDAVREGLPRSLPRPNGEVLGPGKVYHPSGSLDVNYELANLPDLVTSHDTNFRVNPAYPPDLQPRAREQAPAQDQVNGMAAQLQPERLGRSPEANSGAPIVGPDNVVESGNGRTLALAKAYAAGKGGDYRHWLGSQGIDAAGVPRPILIARRVSPLSSEDRVAFAHSANTVSGLAMTDGEKAFADARLISPASISHLSDTGLASTDNQPFVRSFLAQLPATERADFLDAQGALSQKGLRRLEMATMAKAYGDGDFIDKAFVARDLNVRGLAGGLTDAAPAWTKMRQAVRDGLIDPDHDVTPAVMTAARGIVRAREAGRPISEVLNQGDLFGDEPSALAKGLLVNTKGQLAGREQIANNLRNYANEAQKNLAGPGLFGDTVKPAQVLRTSLAKSSGAAPEPEMVSAAMKTGPAANMDQAAAQRLKAASAATKDRAQTFDQGPVGSVLKTQGQAGDYRLADAAVPAKMFSPGYAGAQTIAAYRKAAGPNAETFLHDAAAQSLTREAVRDGVLDPAKYQAWAAKHQDALRALPDTLKAKFANAAAAGDALDQAAVVRKGALDHYQQSAVKPFLKISDPQDVTRTVGGMFEAKDGVQRMSQLADALKDNPDARQGLRKAVADYILSKAKGTTESGSSGIANLNAGRFQTLIRNNAQTLKAAGFSDEEVGLMRALGEDMQRSQRTLQATKLPNQSNTMQDMVSHIQADRGPRNISLLTEMLAGGLTGMPFGPHASVAGALSGLAEHMVRGMRRAGIADASAMVRDAMFNPELARALLARTPKQVGVFSQTQIGKELAKMAVFSGETLNRDNREHRASGGAVNRKSHDELVSRLMEASEQAKNATKRDTKNLLSVPDNQIARALEVAQKAI